MLFTITIDRNSKASKQVPGSEGEMKLESVPFDKIRISSLYCLTGCKFLMN